MNLTPEQSNTIRHWGEKTQHVNEIRLFSSRARGDGAEKSDIDLAVTIGSDDPGTVLGIYYARGQKWQEELMGLLGGSKVHIGLYDDPDSDIVWRSCQECSVVLFP
jgi:predicted nucleotidyltransferase